MTPDEKKMLYAISNPIILNPKSRIYIMIHKRVVFDKFYSHKKSVFEQFTVDMRIWKLDAIQGFWMPIRNGLQIGIEDFPGFLIGCQKLFEFFIQLAEIDLDKNNKNK